MKVKTALQQSRNHARFLAVVLAALLGIAALLPGWGGFVCAGLLAVPLAMEVINIAFILRKSRSDPGYLEERIR